MLTDDLIMVIGHVHNKRGSLSSSVWLCEGKGIFCQHKTLSVFTLRCFVTSCVWTGAILPQCVCFVSFYYYFFYWRLLSAILYSCLHKPIWACSFKQRNSQTAFPMRGAYCSLISHCRAIPSVVLLLNGRQGAPSSSRQETAIRLIHPLHLPSWWCIEP